MYMKVNKGGSINTEVTYPGHGNPRIQWGKLSNTNTIRPEQGSVTMKNLMERVVG